MKKLIFILSLIVVVYSCGEKFDTIEDLSEEKYNLIDQNNASVNFPQIVRGKIAVVGYIFTNCPDICPLTTNNMRLIQERLKEEKVKDVEFVSISFDPLVDKPEVLRKFAEIRNLNLGNWTFLTGEKNVIDSLMKKAQIFAIPGDSTLFPNGEKIIYYIHTDRIQIMDVDGKIRKNYPGSTINVNEIVEDIKSLVD
ncbi:MAG: SCO family protein [Bacteroidota bacterium]